MKDDPQQVYADIIQLPPHRSPYRVPMPRIERAAQFSSFAALSGHARAIHDQTEDHVLSVEQRERFDLTDGESSLLSPDDSPC